MVTAPHTVHYGERSLLICIYRKRSKKFILKNLEPRTCLLLNEDFFSQMLTQFSSVQEEAVAVVVVTMTLGGQGWYCPDSAIVSVSWCQ